MVGEEEKNVGVAWWWTGPRLNLLLLEADNHPMDNRSHDNPQLFFNSSFGHSAELGNRQVL